MRILAEVDKQFDKTLSAETTLLTIPIARYDDLLLKGSFPDSFRPTLFDFLAFEAIRSYSNPEQGGTKPEDAFEIADDSPVFAPVDEFLKWRPATTDANSRTLKTIKLYQKLLAIHRDDAEKSAFLDIDLHRLQFGYDNSFGLDRPERYAAILKAFAEAHAKHELASMARWRWAELMDGRGEKVKAREIAAIGEKAFPESSGGKLCHDLILEIEGKESHLETERIWADPLPDIRITYRNLTKVYFRVVKATDIEELSKEVHLHAKPRRLKALILLKPELAFHRDLPATEDYHQRSVKLAAPTGLKPGRLLSHRQPYTGSFG